MHVVDDTDRPWNIHNQRKKEGEKKKRGGGKENELPNEPNKQSAPNQTTTFAIPQTEKKNRKKNRKK